MDELSPIIFWVVVVFVFANWVYFWWRFHRMMDDVHRIAEALAPTREAKPEAVSGKTIERIAQLRQDHLYKEFRDDGQTKSKAQSGK